jgi:hypothetical protein
MLRPIAAALLAATFAVPAMAQTAAPAAHPMAPMTAPATGKAGTTAANQYKTEADAKTACASDTVVWVNLRSKVEHMPGEKTYGTTKHGAYMCQKEAEASGFHMMHHRATKASSTTAKPATTK